MIGTYALISIVMQQNDDGSVDAKSELRGSSVDLLEMWVRLGMNVCKKIGMSFGMLLFTALINARRVRRSTKETVSINVGALTGGGRDE